MIALLLSSPKVIFGIVIVAALIAIGGAIYFAGGDAVRDSIEQQNQRAEDTAEGAVTDVATCHDMGRSWDVASGTCR